MHFEIIKGKNSKVKEKSNNFKDLKAKIEKFKLKLNKKNQKIDEEKSESNKKIFIINNHGPSIIVNELERDYKLFLEGHNHMVNGIATVSSSLFSVLALFFNILLF